MPKDPRNEREALMSRIPEFDPMNKVGRNFAQRRVRAGSVKLDTGAMPLDAVSAVYSDHSAVPDEQIREMFHTATDFDVRPQTDDEAHEAFMRRYRENYPPRKRRSSIFAIFGKAVVIALVLTALLLQYFGVLLP